MTMNQKQAVYQAITSVLSEADIHFEDGMNASTLITPELRKQVNAILIEGFRSKTIELDREYSDTELKSYVSGLQSNWLRKDKRFNGGVQYVAKNPGSRAGSGDASLKNMRILLSQVTDVNERAEVQGFIDARVAELSKGKTTTKVIDFSALPAELQAKFSK